MPNHFHLVVMIRSEKEIIQILSKINKGSLSIEKKLATEEAYLSNVISKQFGNLFNAYAKYFNSVHQRRGTLFTRAFRRKWVESEDYLKTVNLLCASKSGSGRICQDSQTMDVFLLQCNDKY